MQKLLVVLILILVPVAVFGQARPVGFDFSNYGVRIEAEKRIILVLATLEMAETVNTDGKTSKLINTPLSERGSRFRQQLLSDQANLNEDLRKRISLFVGQYKKRKPNLTDAELISPFLSMAYTLEPVPDLADPAITADLPGGLLDVLDFAPLVREFYRRSGIGAKLDEYVTEYRTEADGILRSSAREMITELLDYLHTRPQIFYSERVTVESQKGTSKKTVLRKVENRDHERRFFIVPEMLAPVGNINFVNIRDDYFVVVPPDKDISNSDVCRAFLRFVIDPLVLKNARDISLVSDQIKILLDEQRKSDPTVSPDVFLTVTRSLVAAVDARQLEYSKSRVATESAREKILKMKTDQEKRAVSTELNALTAALSDETALSLYDAYERGAVLSFYFAEQLRGTEDSGFDLASSMREMIASFDVTKETDRLTKYADARKRALDAREARKINPLSAETVVENPVTVGLLAIQKTIAAKDFVKANADLKQLLLENPSEPRIYYTLGRVASLAAENADDQDEEAQKLLEAKVAFSNVLRTAKSTTDKALLSLTYVALARIYEFFGDADTAIALYDKAIQLDDVAGGAFRDAIGGKQNLLKKP